MCLVGRGVILSLRLSGGGGPQPYTTWASRIGVCWADYPPIALRRKNAEITDSEAGNYQISKTKPHSIDQV